MTIAMVLSGDKEIIVPIVVGEVIRLFRVETGEVKDFENPALKLQAGKRGAVIRWLNERGIHTLCAPPSMLCELSYETAQKEKFRYYRVQNNTSFSELKALILSNSIELSIELPKNEIEPSFFVPENI
ncbi:hypothetical protein ACQKGD_09430 [Peribacillus frigoritolerans]|uniref:hypothetical protein n=1 Tax=Peribacillus frigoritolerans TaxID=450367 RepID=UPI00207A2F23|nr:hypothetical protein [Peribacillus frigoritolerans]USK68265.1 hypothetical protein LIT26_30120 [Peribacillus frigoritolerans]